MLTASDLFKHGLARYGEKNIVLSVSLESSKAMSGLEEIG